MFNNKEIKPVFVGIRGSGMFQIGKMEKKLYPIPADILSRKILMQPSFFAINAKMTVFVQY